MKKLAHLGGLSPQQFLREYWQKKPLLIRQAFPQFKPLLSREALFELASREDVEARLISRSDAHLDTRSGGNWQLQNGPFQRLPSAKKRAWTLLVQGVNLYDDAVDALMQEFRFLPDARLDDVMISYATDTGGVGPHFDSYDVFLLQAHGQRRWRISAQGDLSLLDGVPLKILRNFRMEEEYILEPGDMLYLPPHYAHDGEAVGECMTYSIGFRSPAYQELGEAFLEFMADSIDLPGRYGDADLAPSRNPAEISGQMLARVTDEIGKLRFTTDDITIFLGEYLSEPKVNVVFEPPARPVTLARFRQAAAKRGIRLCRMTRMLYRGKHVFINGESFAVSGKDKASLAGLANARNLDGIHVASASNDVLEALYLWYQDGWLVLR
jgi:50S ribosomal protein L16 3-hydroxylase